MRATDPKKGPRLAMVTTSPETKSFAAPITLKAAGRAFEAIVSTSAIDRDNDVVLPSAFRSGQKVPLIVGHSWERLPVGSGVISTTSRDVRMTGEFFDTAAGIEAYQTAKQLAELTEFSIGFIAQDSDYETRDGRRVRVVKSVELLEVSMVLKGAAIGTGLLDIKSAPTSERWSMVDQVRAEYEDDMSVHNLSRRGYDVQKDASGAGWLQLKGVNLYPSAVVDQPAEADSVDLKQLRTEARAIMHPDYSKSFWEWLKQVRFTDAATAGMMAMATIGSKALSAGLDTAGGYLAPPELRVGVEARRSALAVVRPRATIYPTGRDVLQIPRYGPHDSSPHTYGSDMVGGRFGPAQALPLSDDPDFEMLQIIISSLGTGLKFGNDLMADSDGLQAALIDQGGANLAAVEDNDFLQGDGVGINSLGIWNSPDILSAVVGAPTVGGLQLVLETLPVQYRSNANWIMNASFEADVRALTGTLNDLYVYPRDVGGGTIEGRLPLLTPFGSDAETLLADLSSVVIADRMTLSVIVLSERFVDVDQTALILKARNGIGVLRPNGIVKGTAS
jgi:HK97 family phage major capsid protein/HK97 family phage prohead protease